MKSNKKIWTSILVIVILSLFLLISTLVIATPSLPSNPSDSVIGTIADKVILIDAPSDDASLFDSSITFEFRFELPHMRECIFKVDGSEVDSYSNNFNNQDISEVVDDLDEGDHSWSLSCTDDLGQNYSKKMSFEIKKPQIILNDPLDNEFFDTKKVNFSFTSKVDDTLTCRIYVNENKKYTKTAFVKDGTVEKKLSLGEGVSKWKVNCTSDNDGNTYESEERNFFINTKDASLDVSGDVKVGDYLNISLKNFVPDEYVYLTINNSLGSYDSFSKFIPLKIDGELNDAGALDYSHPLSPRVKAGSYTIYAEQEDYDKSASDSFTVADREVSISTDKNSYERGEKVIITGTNFPAMASNKLKIVNPSGSRLVTVSSDVDGDFSYEYVLLGNYPVGTYTVNASSTLYSLFDIASFEVTMASNEKTLDRDNDGIPDVDDNCLYTPNPSQTDSDNDGIGDACDNPGEEKKDKDGDGIIDSQDNCPNDYNSGQIDKDGDGIGDACDSSLNHDNDYDNDGVEDDYDNCPTKSNPSQLDSDNDGIGDVCDYVTEQPKNTNLGLIFWLIGVFVIIGVLSALGYLWYEGKLDIHHLNNLFHDEAKPIGSKVTDDNYEQLSNFIFMERSKGFDDLTIRSSLIDKGWQKSEVDEIFSKIYNEI